MSEVTLDLIWYPPQFPAKGRLPSHAALIGQHCKKQALPIAQEHILPR